MANLILFLDRLICMYLYFIVGACFLSLVPNINPDYPMFHYIFKFAGFYLIPPIAGFSISPACLMIVAALISLGLNKIYMKFYAEKEPKVIVVTEEILKQMSERKRKEQEDDCNEDN